MPLVKQKEIGKCAGVVVNRKMSEALKLPRSDGVCRSKIPMRIMGYDDRWRCPGCHKIHIELVYADTRQKDQKAHV